MIDVEVTSTSASFFVASGQEHHERCGRRTPADLFLQFHAVANLAGMNDLLLIEINQIMKLAHMCFPFLVLMLCFCFDGKNKRDVVSMRKRAPRLRGEKPWLPGEPGV